MYKRKRSSTQTGSYQNRAFKKPRTAPHTRTAYNQNFRFTPRSFGNAIAVTERKYFDGQSNGNLNSSATSWAGCEADQGVYNCLGVPVQGNDIANRIGRKIQVLSLKLRGRVIIPPQQNQSTGDAAACIRVIIVLDKQTNGVQLNAEDVISSGQPNFGTEMFQNTAFFGRFKVLKDKKFVLQNPAVAYDGTNLEQQGLSKWFEWIIKFRKPVVMHFNATNGGTVADIIDNSFHCIASTSSTDLVPNLTFKYRMCFLDV